MGAAKLVFTESGSAYLLSADGASQYALLGMELELKTWHTGEKMEQRLYATLIDPDRAADCVRGFLRSAAGEQRFAQFNLILDRVDQLLNHHPTFIFAVIYPGLELKFERS